MSKSIKISALPGDGIGIEIYKEAEKILNWFDTSEYSIDVSEMPVGASIDKHEVLSLIKH